MIDSLLLGNLREKQPDIIILILRKHSEYKNASCYCIKGKRQNLSESHLAFSLSEYFTLKLFYRLLK